MTGLFHKSKGNILIPVISAWLARCGIRNRTLVFLRQCPPYLFQELLPEYVSAIQSLRQLLFEPQSRFSSAFYWCFHFVHGNKVRTFCSPSMLRTMLSNEGFISCIQDYPRTIYQNIWKNTNCRVFPPCNFPHFPIPSLEWDCARLSRRFTQLQGARPLQAASVAAQLRMYVDLVQKDHFSISLVRRPRDGMVMVMEGLDMVGYGLGWFPKIKPDFFF